MLPTYKVGKCGADHIPAFIAVKRMLYALDKSLTFRFDKWQLSRHDGEQLDAIFSRHQKENRITKDPVREQLGLTS